MKPQDSRPTVIRVEAQIFEDQRAEFDLLMQELLTGARVRVQSLERERAAVTARALEALTLILDAVRQHPGTGQARRLVHFLAGLYNGTDYPFDLSDLRPLDTPLANACLDYLNYDRLAIRDLDRHLGDRGRELQGWIARYEIRAVAPRP